MLPVIAKQTWSCSLAWVLKTGGDQQGRPEDAKLCHFPEELQYLLFPKLPTTSWGPRIRTHEHVGDMSY